MREGFSVVACFAAGLSMTATACSLLVSTAGLGGGAEADGGASTQTDPSGGGGPGVTLGEAGTVATNGDGAGNGSGSTGAPGDAASPIPPGDAASGSPPPVAAHDAGPADAGRDAADAAPGPCSLGHARVFATSTMYDGDLGGVSGADAKCGARAVAGGLGGSWRAWLSDTSTPAVVHIRQSPGDYVLLDGTRIAENTGTLFSGSLAHAINLTELGAISDGLTEVWTGIDVTGAGVSAGFCGDGSGSDWSSNSVSGPTPLVGHTDATDTTWTAAYLQACNRTNVRLYCFEACP